jgi:hypothetical protein
MMDHLSVGPATQTGPELVRFRTLIAFHPDDPVSLYMQPKWASAPAIKGGSGPDDPDFVTVRTGIGSTHSYLPGCRLTTRLAKIKKENLGSTIPLFPLFLILQRLSTATVFLAFFLTLLSVGLQQ